MKHAVNRQMLNPVLAPDQFSAAKPLGPEDLDRYVTRHGIYPAFPAPTGAPWIEYVRSQMHWSRTVSSSTEALDSDHASYITIMIAQHARLLATGTRSLPTDSPGPYFQQIPQERGQTSKGVPSDMDLPIFLPHITQNVQIPTRQANSDILPYLLSNSIEYDKRGVNQDRLSTYTSLDDYDAMFEARHGRGAIDNMTVTGEKVSVTSPIMVPTPAVCMSLTMNSMTGSVSKHTPSGVYSLSSQQGQASVEEEYQSPAEHDVVPPVGVGHILGEGATNFTDMTKTMLDALDKQMAQPDTVQKSVSSSLNNLLASGPISSQREIRQDMLDIKASQPLLQSLHKDLSPCPFLLQKGRINTLTYTCLSVRIIGLVTSFMGMQIVCQWIKIL